MKKGIRFLAFAMALISITLSAAAAGDKVTKKCFSELQKKASELNSGGNPLRDVVKYLWSGEKWDKDSKESYNYDSRGRVSEVFTYMFENENFDEKQKSVFEYYGDSDYIKKITLKMSMSGTYFDFGYMEMIYNENWKIKEQILSVLIPNPLISDTKIVYNWDGDEMAEVIVYDKEGSEWVYNSRTTYIYGNTTLPDESMEYAWEGGEWVETIKTSYEFNENDSLAVEIELTKNDDNWINSNKTVYDYDGLLKKKESTYTWGEDWVNETKTDYKYNSAEKPESEISQIWIADEWQNNEMYEYFYDGTSAVADDNNTANTLIISPNPAAGQINISGVEFGEVTIMTIEGVVVKTARGDIIDTGSLAPGMYIVKAGRKTAMFIKY